MHVTVVIDVDDRIFRIGDHQLGDGRFGCEAGIIFRRRFRHAEDEAVLFFSFNNMIRIVENALLTMLHGILFRRADVVYRYFVVCLNAAFTIIKRDNFLFLFFKGKAVERRAFNGQLELLAFLVFVHLRLNGGLVI